METRFVDCHNTPLRSLLRPPGTAQTPGTEGHPVPSAASSFEEGAVMSKILRIFLLLGVLALCAAAMADEAILRYEEDPARNRAWLLTRSGVLVFDLTTRQTVAQASLPGWVWAGETFACPPGLALGPKGEALISSNVKPALWRVDPVSFAVTRHAPVLDADSDKDVGFTGLTFSKVQGSFYAVSDYGALWRIDPLLARAQKIDLNAPLLRACGVAVRTAKSGFNRFFGLCVRGPQGGWTVNLAPDRRSGYVLAQPCSS
jgi:hypothetical protein